ncbi:hypothetical protein DVR12_00405 [Chitinophaga silvatica]|uniref:Uncharacterized protein n=1 Tax=Chitinophaga silvatica TaxID=2282649 RepID=A0A3E1YFW1_9BACT|nr:hypothetical protein DVR12_00405 [Chitinophaga silvatica]
MPLNINLCASARKAISADIARQGAKDNIKMQRVFLIEANFKMNYRKIFSKMEIYLKSLSHLLQSFFT